MVDVGDPEIAPHHTERRQHDVCRQRAHGRQEPHDDEEDDPGGLPFMMDACQTIQAKGLSGNAGQGSRAGGACQISAQSRSASRMAQ